MNGVKRLNLNSVKECNKSLKRNKIRNKNVQTVKITETDIYIQLVTCSLLNEKYVDKYYDKQLKSLFCLTKKIILATNIYNIF